MQDRYFPGFQFRKFKPPAWYGVKRQSQEASERPPISFVPEIEHYDPNRLTKREVHRIFTQGLKSLGDEVGESLSMRGRALVFVTQDHMKPQSEEEKEYLLKRYGKYIIEGSGGGTYKNKDGTFTLEVVDNGSPETELEGRFHNAAHEYGHTLGDTLWDHPVCEEIKAYAFQELFMRQLLGVRNLTPPMNDNVHQMAWFRLQQLTRAGVRPEAIIAHLIGRPFGRFGPEDYRYIYPSGIIQAQAIQAL